MRPSDRPASPPERFVVGKRPWLVWAARQRTLTTLLRPAPTQPLWNNRRQAWEVPGIRPFVPDGPTLPANGFRCPFGPPGRRIYLREAVATRWDIDEDLKVTPDRVETLARARHYCRWRADESGFDPKDPNNWHSWGRGWKPAAAMPRWAARVAFEVDAIDYVKLPALSETDLPGMGLHPWTKDGALYKWSPADREGDGPAWPWVDCPKDPREALDRAWAELWPKYPAELDRWTWRATVRCVPDPVGCALDSPHADPLPTG